LLLMCKATSFSSAPAPTQKMIESVSGNLLRTLTSQSLYHKLFKKRKWRLI
jgi:hypothetical protein